MHRRLLTCPRRFSLIRRSTPTASPQNLRAFPRTMTRFAARGDDGTFEAGWPQEKYRTRVLRIPSSSVRFSHPHSPEAQDPSFHDRPEDDGIHPAESPAESSSAVAMRAAAARLRAGNLVAFPTETVYGLGANATDARAVGKIFITKGRPNDNPLIVHISDLDMLQELIPGTKSDADAAAEGWRPSAAYRCLMRKFWPGSMTLLFPIAPGQTVLPPETTCGLPAVGIRMPSHPVARALIRLAGVPVAAPSSNASGRPSPTTAAHVAYDLGGTLDRELGNVARKTSEEEPIGRVAMILDGGACDVGLESTVIDGITEPSELRVLRPGGLTVEEIKEALQEAELLQGPDEAATSEKVKVRVYGKDMQRSEKAEATPTTPGMKYKHYSPNAKVVLLETQRSGDSDGATASQRLEHTFRQILQQELLALRDASSSGTARKDKTPRIGLMVPSDSPVLNIAKSVADDAMKLNARGSMPAETLSLHLPLGGGGGGGDDEHVQAATLFLYDLGPTTQPKQIAARLFAGLRQLDEDPLAQPTLSDADVGSAPPLSSRETGCDVILVQTMDAASIGLAYMNRLEKAASQRYQVQLP